MTRWWDWQGKQVPVRSSNGNPPGHDFALLSRLLRTLSLNRQLSPHRRGDLPPANHPVDDARRHSLFIHREKSRLDVVIRLLSPYFAETMVPLPCSHTMKPSYHRPDNAQIHHHVVAIIGKLEA